MVALQPKEINQLFPDNPLDDQLALIAMDQLGKHIRICQYGRWDGSEQSIQHSMHYVDTFLDGMKKNVIRHRNDIDLKRWFPSLS